MMRQAGCGVCKRRVLKGYAKVPSGGDRPYHERPIFICSVLGKVVGYYHRVCRSFTTIEDAAHVDEDV